MTCCSTCSRLLFQTQVYRHSMTQVIGTAGSIDVESACSMLPKPFSQQGPTRMNSSKAMRLSLLESTFSMTLRISALLTLRPSPSASVARLFSSTSISRESRLPLPLLSTYSHVCLCIFSTGGSQGNDGHRHASMCLEHMSDLPFVCAPLCVTVCR